MKFAIVESVVTPGGHEIDYDRILVEELTKLGHSVEFYVPEGHDFKWNYGVPVHFLPGEGVSYAGARGIKKAWLALKREINRRRWYHRMYQLACCGNFDAIIFPSATYRYLRALHHSQLLKSPVPVLFIIHGLTPAESERLNEQAIKVSAHQQIKIAVQTFALKELKAESNNIHYCSPPTYIPRDIPALTGLRNRTHRLRLGFFGQYRREKNLDAFLDMCLCCKFSIPVELVIQGATQTEADAEDFQRIIQKYQHASEWVTFIPKPLIGQEWQQAIAEVDSVMMPYGNERYRYHTAAMLSTAIGFYKPILISDIINPEVWNEYNIGYSFKNGDTQNLRQALENFVNTFDQQYAIYESELRRANEAFAPARLAKFLVGLANSR